MVKRFFVIGAMKCATSSLHSHLATHPQLCAARTKEPRFFLTAKVAEPDWKHYADLFAGHDREKWLFESSTGYSKAPARPGVPARIHSRFPEARFVYMLRDPVDRIYSHYLHNYGRGREVLPFGKAIRRDPEYVDVSRYFMQISEYLNFFPKEQLCVVTLEDFARSKISVLRTIFEFLGVDSDFVPPNLDEVVNRTASQRMLPRPLQRLDYRTQTVQKALKKLPVIGPALRRLAAPLHCLERPLPSKADLQDGAAEDFIRAALHDDLRRLVEFLGRPLDWPSTRDLEIGYRDRLPRTVHC